MQATPSGRTIRIVQDPLAGSAQNSNKTPPPDSPEAISSSPYPLARRSRATSAGPQVANAAVAPSIDSNKANPARREMVKIRFMPLPFVI